MSLRIHSAACTIAISEQRVQSQRPFTLYSAKRQAGSTLCQVVNTAMCYKYGGMVDDGIVFRLGDADFRWIGGNDTSGLWLRVQARKRGLTGWVRNSSDQLHNDAAQGLGQESS